MAGAIENTHLQNTDAPFLIYFDLINGPISSLQPVAKLVFSTTVRPSILADNAFRLQSSASSSDVSMGFEGSAVENDPSFSNILLLSFTSNDVSRLRATPGLGRSANTTFLTLAPNALMTERGVLIVPIFSTLAKRVRFYGITHDLEQSDDTIDNENANLVAASTMAPLTRPPLLADSKLHMDDGTITLVFVDGINVSTLLLGKLKISRVRVGHVWILQI